MVQVKTVRAKNPKKVTSRQLNKLVPLDWGKDNLSQLFETLFDNLVATFANSTDEYAKLREIDAVFIEIGSNMINAKPVMPAFFMMRCHSALCAAFQLALSGQNSEAYVLTRSALEYAAYGNLIALDEKLVLTWLNRNTSAKAMDEQKKAFIVRKLREGLEKRDKDLATRWQRFYEEAIDFGAHPNQLAIMSSMQKEDGVDRTNWLQTFTQPGSLSHTGAMKHAARVGLTCLLVFAHIYNARFELLGLKPRLSELRKGL